MISKNIKHITTNQGWILQWKDWHPVPYILDPFSTKTFKMEHEKFLYTHITKLLTEVKEKAKRCTRNL